MSAHFRRVTIILAEMIRVSKGVCSVLSTDSDFFKENMTILILHHGILSRAEKKSFYKAGFEHVMARQAHNL